MLNKQLCRFSVLLLIFVELLSLTGFIFPAVNALAFFVIILAVLIISLYRLEWGLYIVLAELFIGSLGRLFSFEFNGVEISLRIALFVVILAVWLGKTLSRIVIKSDSHKVTEPKSCLESCSGAWREFLLTKIGKWYTALGVALLWGLLWGLKHNDFANVFFDFNNWLFFLYILPFYDIFVLRSRQGMLSKENYELGIRNYEEDKENSKLQITNAGDKGVYGKLLVTSYQLLVTNILTLLAASVIVLSVKTILLEFFFAHQAPGTIEMLYRWIRDFGIGEITFYASNFYRVFLQGQIWLLLGFFIFLGIFVTENPKYTYKFSKFEIRNSKFEKNTNNPLSVEIITNRKKSKFQSRIILLILILSSMALIISFSRSLWLGWLGGLGLFYLVLLFKLKWPWKKLFKWGAGMLGIAILEILFIFILINVPPVTDRGDFGALLSERATQIEAAGSSRLNLLRPLFMGIINHPVIGSGFGATITYQSADPRIVSSTAGASGQYTTYAFEWGYLDIMLKVGLAGLLAYLGLLWQLGRQAGLIFNSPFPIFKKIPLTKVQYFEVTGVKFGFFLALAALLITNLTTPYLNHPLGIGFIVLSTAILYAFTGVTISKQQ